MNDVCRTGFREIQQLEQEQQARLDSALIRSMQPDREAGMQGEPLPYLLRSDWLVTLCLFLCFLLYSYALRNGKKYLAQRFRNFFQHKQRGSLFDEPVGSEVRYTLTMGGVTCILGGFCLYDYFSDNSSLLFQIVPHSLLLGIYVTTIFLLVSFKWISYSFINWIFFDKEKNRSWIRSWFDLQIGTGVLLFPVVLLIVYFDLKPDIAKTLVVIILCFAKILLFYKCIKNFFNHFHGCLHLILYFCTLEIIPDLLLWKGINYINHILILNF